MRSRTARAARTLLDQHRPGARATPGISWLVRDLDPTLAATRSLVTLVNALAASHAVEVLVLHDGGAAPGRAGLDPHVRLVHLQPTDRDGDDGPSRLVPPAWDDRWDMATDDAMVAALAGMHGRVLITHSPGLLAAASQVAPRDVVLAHLQKSVPEQGSREAACLLAVALRADAVVTPAHGVASWLADQLGDRVPPTHVLPLPVSRSTSPARASGADGEDPVIVAAGRLVAESRFPRLVSAFGDVARDLPDWRLRVVGGGPQRGELRRTITRAGLEERVLLTDAVADPAMAWVGAAVAVFPGRRADLCPELQEAMAAGLPVVAADGLAGVREAVQHEVNGLLVASGSRPDLASALLRLATDEELRHRLGRSARGTATAWQADDLLDRWRSLLGGLADGEPTRPSRSVASPPTAHRTTPSRTTPVEARRAGMACAVAAAEQAGNGWFVMPAPWPETPTVVVPMPLRERLLSALSEVEAPAQLCLVERSGRGWPDPRGPLRQMAGQASRGRASRLTLEPWPLPGRDPGLLSHGCAVDVEFWPVAPSGELVAPTANCWTGSVPAGTTPVGAEVDGVAARVLPLMVLPMVTQCRFPVDVIYTWVDGDDPAWNAARDERLAQVTGTAKTSASSGGVRFTSRDELRYSMRSVHLFAPWVRHVHLVTAGQVPEWLDTSHEQVSVVDHRDILPPDALPTFNSQAIETALHHVPGLTEQFLYLNDDVFLARPVGPEAFFTAAGQPFAFLSPNLVGLTGDPEAAPYLRAAWNNRRLVEDDFGATLTHRIAHAPHPHRRSLLEEVGERYPDDLARTARTPFRSDTDVSLLSSLAQHYGLATGGAVASSPKGSRFVSLGSPGLKRQLGSLLERRQDFFCVGESHSSALPAETANELLADFLGRYLPVRAPWEKG